MKKLAELLVCFLHPVAVVLVWLNVIVRPDLFSEHKRAIVGEPYLLVEGTLQIQEGVTSIKAERVIGLSGGGPEPQSHDFR